MNAPLTPPSQADAAGSEVSAQALAQAESYIEAEEGAANKFQGALAVLITVLALAMSVFHLYTAYAIVPTQTLRPLHVSMVLVLTYLMFPLTSRFRHRIMLWDWVAVLLSLAVVWYLIQGGDDFTDRNTMPENWDIFFGIVLIGLILEAMRRTNGWIMPVITLGFIAYALVGPWLPAPWTHKGYEVGRLIGVLYMTLEGIYGSAVDVSSSLIILFTIFGAFLQYSGAGKFYIDFSFAAMGGKPTGAGRTVVLASFLLGGPSGSGVATTVTLGAVAYETPTRSRFLDVAMPRDRGLHAVGFISYEAGAAFDLVKLDFKGVRLNLATGGGNDPGVARRQFDTVAARVKRLNWHVQLNTNLAMVAALKDTFAASPVPVVFDHFGGTNAARGVKEPGFDAMLDLVKAGRAYVKISATELFSTTPPHFAGYQDMARALIAAADSDVENTYIVLTARALNAPSGPTPNARLRARYAPWSNWPRFRRECATTRR